MAPDSNPLATSDTFRHRTRFAVTLVVATAVILYVVWITREAVLLVFLGVAVGVLFYSLSRWLSDKTGIPRGVTLAGVAVAVIGLLALAAFWGGPRLVDEARGLVEQGPQLLNDALARLGVSESAADVLPQFSDVSGRVLGIFSSVLGALAGLLVVFLVAIYTAAAPQRYTDAVTRLFDRTHQPFVRRVIGRSAEMLLGWLKGVGIAVTALTVIAVVGLSVIGLPGAIALAVFAGALTVIPNIGPFIGWTPAVIVAFSQGTTTGLWTLGLAIVAQQIEGGFIEPKVQGELVDVPPAFIIAGQIVLGAIVGFLGVLLIVPVLGVGKVLLQELYIGPLVEGEPAEPDADSAEPDGPGALASPNDAAWDDEPAARPTPARRASP